MGESVPSDPRMIRSARLLHRAFTGACIAWAGALPAAAFAATRPQPASMVYLFAFAVYAIGSIVCHQRSERSFFLWGRQLPVCARCTGIYMGAALTVAVLAVRRSAEAFALQSAARTVPRSNEAFALRSAGRRSVKAFALRSAAPSVIVAALPTGITLAFEWTTGVTPGNWVRAAAGFVLGGAVAWRVVREFAASPEVN
jgi:Predicted membrane protein (DUF2085)